MSRIPKHLRPYKDGISRGLRCERGVGSGEEGWRPGLRDGPCPHHIQSCSRPGAQCSPLTQAALQAFGPWGWEEVRAKSGTPSRATLSPSPLAVATLPDTSWMAHAAAGWRSAPARTGLHEQGNFRGAGHPRGSMCVLVWCRASRGPDGALRCPRPPQSRPPREARCPRERPTHTVGGRSGLGALHA